MDLPPPPARPSGPRDRPGLDSEAATAGNLKQLTLSDRTLRHSVTICGRTRTGVSARFFCRLHTMPAPDSDSRNSMLQMRNTLSQTSKPADNLRQ
ncbi:hypothetical protein SPHV1_2430031 [Novosphingobium sp. KN65.2]|nr:hypothetical protein SPHV1_2430031 [Novosphingobium sp. KN65.2]